MTPPLCVQPALRVAGALLLALATLMACTFSAQIGIVAPAARPVAARRTERDEDDDENTENGTTSVVQTDTDDPSSADSATTSQGSQSGNQSASAEDNETDGDTQPAQPGTQAPSSGAGSDDVDTVSSRIESDVDDAWVRTEHRDGGTFYLLRDDDSTHRRYEHVDADSHSELSDDRDRSTTQIQLREATSEFGEIAENRPAQQTEDVQRPVEHSYATGEDGTVSTETYTEYYTDDDSRVGVAYQDVTGGRLVTISVRQSEYEPDQYREEPQTVHLLEDGHGLSVHLLGDTAGGKVDMTRPIVGFDASGNAYWRDDAGNLVQVNAREEIFNSEGAAIGTVAGEDGALPTIYAVGGVIPNPYRGGGAFREHWWDSLTLEEKARASSLYATYDGGYREGQGYTASATRAYDELKEWQDGWFDALDEDDQNFYGYTNTVSDGHDPHYVPGAESGSEHAAGLAGQVEGRRPGEGLTIEYTTIEVDGVEYEFRDYELDQLRDIGALDDDGSLIRATDAPDGVSYSGETDTYSRQSDLGPHYAGDEEQATVHLLSEDAGITFFEDHIPTYNDGHIGPLEREVVGFDDEGRAYWRDDDGTLKRITETRYEGDAFPREVIGWTDDGQIITVTRKERATVRNEGDGTYVPGAESGSEHAAGLSAGIDGRAAGEGLTLEYTTVVVDGVEYELNDAEVAQWRDIGALGDDGPAVRRADSAPDDVDYTGQTDTYLWAAANPYGVPRPDQEQPVTVHLLSEDAGITFFEDHIPTYNDGHIGPLERQVVGFDDEGRAYWRNDDGILERIDYVRYEGDAWPREVIGWTDDGQVIAVERKERATVTHKNPHSAVANYDPSTHPALTDPNHPNYRPPEQPGGGEGADPIAADGTPEVDPNAAPVETQGPTSGPTLSSGSGFFEQDTDLTGSLGTVEQAEADAAAQQERQETPPPPPPPRQSRDDDDDDDSHPVKDDDAQAAEDVGGFGGGGIHGTRARRERKCRCIRVFI